jgi:sugar phosphate isomerase/epimerase
MMIGDVISRRAWLATAGAASAAPLVVREAAAVADQAHRPADEPFGYCLNTSTIRGQNVPIARTVALAAMAGYRGLEPWVSELDDHVKAGGSLDDLGKTIRDLGLTVESAIAFFEWAADDEARRRQALEDARRTMENVRRIGGTRIAAPPAGLTKRSDVDPRALAERYRTLLELGGRVGVVPQVEVWGFSKTLGTLGEAALVAIAADHPDACVLPDVYHLYKGGSGFHGLKLLADGIHVIHVNDYPADPPRDRINDADRVYPGDGIAPLGSILRDLHAGGFRGMLSVELFNRAYWKDEPDAVLSTALTKLRAVVRAAMAGRGT